MVPMDEWKHITAIYINIVEVVSIANMEAIPRHQSIHNAIDLEPGNNSTWADIQLVGVELNQVELERIGLNEVKLN